MLHKDQYFGMFHVPCGIEDVKRCLVVRYLHISNIYRYRMAWKHERINNLMPKIFSSKLFRILNIWCTQHTKSKKKLFFNFFKHYPFQILNSNKTKTVQHDSFKVTCSKFVFSLLTVYLSFSLAGDGQQLVARGLAISQLTVCVVGSIGLTTRGSKVISSRIQVG